MKSIKLSQKLSFVPLQIGLFANSKELSIATAFFYQFDDKTYLITNWHNVAGRELHDLSPKHKQSGALPTQLALRIPSWQKVASGQTAIGWVGRILDLYDDAEEAAPEKAVWLEHPTHGYKVDAVAIPLQGLEETASVAANDSSLGLEQIAVSVGMDAFVLGYPRGLTGGGRFPLWKRATIASEPDIDIGSLPLLYIDTATREGMSGSPVYAQASGFWPVEGKPFPEGGFLGVGFRFMGVYSGRLKGDEFEAQIGKVWKEEAIIEIIRDGKKGKSSWGYTTITPPPQVVERPE